MKNRPVRADVGPENVGLASRDDLSACLHFNCKHCAYWPTWPTRRP